MDLKSVFLVVSCAVGCAGVDESGADKEGVLGALDAADISDAVNAEKQRIKRCYDAGLSLDPALSGRVEVKFVIGADGLVSRAELFESTIESEEVEDCIVDAITDIEFPPPEGGGIVVVQYPFVLAS